MTRRPAVFCGLKSLGGKANTGRCFAEGGGENLQRGSSDQTLWLPPVKEHVMLVYVNMWRVSLL